MPGIQPYSSLELNLEPIVEHSLDPSWAKLLASNCGSTTGTGDVFVFQGSPSLTTPTIASFVNATHTHQASASGGTLDHGAAITGLTDDDHTQYALLAGRSGGQTLQGGTAASNVLSLESTANATKGTVDVLDRLRIAVTAPTYTTTGILLYAAPNGVTIGVRVDRCMR